MVQVLHCYVCLFVLCYVRIQVFTVGIVQIVGCWVLMLCGRVSWHQCFGVTCWLYLILWRYKVEGDSEVIRVKMWCNCVSSLQQMRAVSIMGRWEDLKGMVGPALSQLPLTQTEVSVLSAPFWASYWPHFLQPACIIAIHCHPNYFNINVDPVSSFQRQRLACSPKPSLSALHGVKTWKMTEWSDLFAGHK
jgi:hypothetical protein